MLLVLDRTDEIAWKSFRNLGDRVRIILPEELNTYDVLVSDWLVFTQAHARHDGGPARGRTAKADRDRRHRDAGRGRDRGEHRARRPDRADGRG